MTKYGVRALWSYMSILSIYFTCVSWRLLITYFFHSRKCIANPLLDPFIPDILFYMDLLPHAYKEAVGPSLWYISGLWAVLQFFLFVIAALFIRLRIRFNMPFQKFFLSENIVWKYYLYDLVAGISSTMLHGYLSITVVFTGIWVLKFCNGTTCPWIFNDFTVWWRLGREAFGVERNHPVLLILKFSLGSTLWSTRHNFSPSGCFEKIAGIGLFWMHLPYRLFLCFSIVKTLRGFVNLLLWMPDETDKRTPSCPSVPSLHSLQAFLSWIWLKSSFVTFAFFFLKLCSTYAAKARRGP